MRTNLLSNLCKYAMILFIACSFSPTKIQAQTYLLDGLSESSKTPTLAYSVRKLKSAYQGPAMRLFRSSDNDTVDVYFDANGIVSMSSPVSASKGGAATSTTLETWVGSNSAFVTIWYDQSGNGRNARNKTPIKKYNDYLVTDGSAIALLGNPMPKYDTYTAITSWMYSATSLNLTIADKVVSKNKMPVTSVNFPLFSYIAVENGPKTNWSFNFTPDKAVKGDVVTAYANTNSLLPYNVLMDESGRYIGLIKSFESSNSITLTKPTANAIYEPLKWGVSNLPCLILEGKLQMMNENMAALRILSGQNSGARLQVDTFRNDMGERMMRKVIAMNLLSVVKQNGNFSATNGAVYFGTRTTTTQGIDRKFCAALTSTSSMVPSARFVIGFNGYGTNTTTYVNSTLVTRNTVKADNTGSFRSSMSAVSTVASPVMGKGFTPGKVINTIKIDTILVWDATLNADVKTVKRDTTFYTTVAGVASDALDESPIQLFGYNESDRGFEGLGSEFIFYASGIADAPEVDMDNVYVDQQLNFTSAPATLLSTVSGLTTTTATIKLSIYRLDGIPGVTERGFFYGTTANTTSNEIIDAAPNTGDFSKALTGLIPNTKYYYSGYSANAIKKGFTDEKNFTTYSLAPDSVKPATDITYNSFRANWAPVGSAQGSEPYTYTIQYARDSMFTRGTTTVWNIPTSKHDTVVSNILSDSTYYFRVRVNNVSGSTAWTKFKSAKIATAPAGVKELKQLLLNVVPNPVSDKIEVTLEKSAMIQVFNITGQKVLEVKGLEGTNTISVTELQNGQYIVKVANRVAKVIKL